MQKYSEYKAAQGHTVKMWTVDGDTLMQGKNDDLTLCFGHDGLCGVRDNDLNAGLKAIGWDHNLAALERGDSLQLDNGGNVISIHRKKA
jgi:hypothetical protein